MTDPNPDDRAGPREWPEPPLCSECNCDSMRWDCWQSRGFYVDGWVCRCIIDTTTHACVANADGAGAEEEYPVGWARCRGREADEREP